MQITFAKPFLHTISGNPSKWRCGSVDTLHGQLSQSLKASRLNPFSL
jgi:hypothetical protein